MNLLYENGEYVLNENYQEIIKLHEMLLRDNIPHELKRLMDGWQIIYPEEGNNRISDAIEHSGSYGNENDRLEIMGLLTKKERKHDSVLGGLTAVNVYNRIKSHYKPEKE